MGDSLSVSSFVEMIRMLVEAGSDINAKCDDGRTALHFMFCNGDPALHSHVLAGITTLIEEGIDINAKDEDGTKALLGAMLCNRNDCIRKLVAAGCNIEEDEFQTRYAWIAKPMREYKQAVADNISLRAATRVALEEIRFEDYTNIKEFLNFL